MRDFEIEAVATTVKKGDENLLIGEGFPRQWSRLQDKPRRW